MIELRIWRRGDDPGLSSWAQCPYKVEAGGSETAERESETGGRTLLAWRTEAGPGRPTSVAGLGAGKGPDAGSALEPPEGARSCRHLEFNRRGPFRTSDL